MTGTSGRPMGRELTVALGMVWQDKAGRRVTNKQIAAHVHVHPSQIGRYLSGQKSPNLEEIRLISEAVGVDWLDALREAHKRVGSPEVVLAVSDLSEAEKKAFRNELADTRSGDDTTES